MDEAARAGLGFRVCRALALAQSSLGGERSGQKTRGASALPLGQKGSAQPCLVKKSSSANGC